MAGPKKSMNSYLFANGSLRLFMEAYLNLTLFSFLNMYELEWIEGIPASTASNIFAMFVSATVCILPVFILIYFRVNKPRWEEEAFQANRSTFFDGLRYQNGYQATFMVY